VIQLSKAIWPEGMKHLLKLGFNPNFQIGRRWHLVQQEIAQGSYKNVLKEILLVSARSQAGISELRKELAGLVPQSQAKTSKIDSTSKATNA
jgi:hypothetical protein